MHSSIRLNVLTGVISFHVLKIPSHVLFARHGRGSRILKPPAREKILEWLQRSSSWIRQINDEGLSNAVLTPTQNETTLSRICPVQSDREAGIRSDSHPEKRIRTTARAGQSLPRMGPSRRPPKPDEHTQQANQSRTSRDHRSDAATNDLMEGPNLLPGGWAPMMPSGSGPLFS